MTTDIKNRLTEAAALTEDALRAYMAREDEDIKTLLDSERYSLFAGGKRIRPFLTLEFCKLFGGDERAALPFAAAVEMIHTYSLIHDDLPCMDNDDLRRGKPTNHKVFGYSTALLAGDGLLTHAFGVAASNAYVESTAALAAVRALSDAAGEFGMIGGQIIDLYGEEERLSEEKLVKLHTLKTGALIKVSAKMGCLAAGCAEDSPEMAAALEYAARIGLAFQIIDDIMDVTVSEEVLGKSAGSDAENNKTTFMTYYSVDDAKAYATRLTAEAVSAIADYAGSETLTDLAAYLLDRDH
jgi:geranylgeranyl diphosphate synthase type II